MARSPSSHARYIKKLASAASDLPTNASGAIIAERRERRLAVDGLQSRLGTPRLESHGAESAGHYRWRNKNKNLAKPFNKSGQVTKVVK